MNRFLIIHFLIISLLIGVSSCSPPLKGFSPSLENAIVFRPVYNTGFDRSIHRFQINFKKKQLTGIVLIKEIPGLNSYRTVFMSETGLKYFDFEFFPNDSVEVHRVMDAFDRKALINIITSDFMLLFKSKVENNNLKVFQSKEEDVLLLHFKQNGKYYYKYISQNVFPLEVEKRSCLAPRTNIEIKSYEEGIPSNIIFSHGILGYTMKLELLNQQK